MEAKPIEVDRVRAVLAERVRPLLLQHGGDIELVEVQGHLVKVRFLGSCSSCPSLSDTLHGIVESSLREVLGQERIEVVLRQGVSDDLIAQARSILSRHKRQD